MLTVWLHSGTFGWFEALITAVNVKCNRLERRTKAYHLRVNGNLGKAFPFAPEERVGLITEESLPDASWRNPQQVAPP